MRRLAALLIIVALALVLAACGDDMETPATRPPRRPRPPATRADGRGHGGPASRRRFRAATGCDPAALAKAIAGTKDTMRACTEIYGGPETAHVTGTSTARPST